MEAMTPLIYIVMALLLLLGLGLGYLARQLIANEQLRQSRKEAHRLVANAETKQNQLIEEAREEARRVKATSEAEVRERRAEIQRLERRFSQTQEMLERKLENTERRENVLAQQEKDNDALRLQLEELKKKQLQQLELVSGMSTTEAKQLLLGNVETEIRDEASRRVREWETKIREEAEAKSRDILSLAIQRCATEVVSETTTSAIPLPSDDMKGRLIGREGRNIRALEQATGVDLIIDDTPETVTISSLDPVRREVARISLNKLILDGRIHPARIEEIVEKAKEDVQNAIRIEGEQAIVKSGVHGIHPELAKLLGRLKYRSSYGQNVLLHSLEVTHLSGMIAAEIGANPTMAKKAGLLHDIGKAVDHEVEGSHAAIGANLVRQWEKSAEIIQAIAEHHGESGTTSVLGFIVSTADAISGSRPGARREAVDQYLKRIEALESVANSFPGVEKAYAIQAGREVRIMVKPEVVDDLTAMRLARDIVKKIEETMQYPGQIKVTVVRETRAVEYAK